MSGLQTNNENFELNLEKNENQIIGIGASVFGVLSALAPIVLGAKDMNKTTANNPKLIIGSVLLALSLCALIAFVHQTLKIEEKNKNTIKEAESEKQLALQNEIEKERSKSKTLKEIESEAKTIKTALIKQHQQNYQLNQEKKELTAQKNELEKQKEDSSLYVDLIQNRIPLLKREILSFKNESKKDAEYDHAVYKSAKQKLENKIAEGITQEKMLAELKTLEAREDSHLNQSGKKAIATLNLQNTSLAGTKYTIQTLYFAYILLPQSGNDEKQANIKNVFTADLLQEEEKAKTNKDFKNLMESKGNGKTKSLGQLFASIPLDQKELESKQKAKTPQKSNNNSTQSQSENTENPQTPQEKSKLKAALNKLKPSKKSDKPGQNQEIFNQDEKEFFSNPPTTISEDLKNPGTKAKEVEVDAINTKTVAA